MFKLLYIFIIGCCILLRIYPAGSLWRRQSQQNCCDWRNHKEPIIVYLFTTYPTIFFQLIA
jgi:hypothetical protein